MRLRRVVDVEERFAGREAEAVRLVEVVDEELWVAAARRDPVDALEGELLLTLDAEAGHPPVGRVAEVDRAVGVDDDVVRAVQLLALVVRREHLAAAPRPVGVEPDDAGRGVLAHDQAPVRVERHPVALVARLRDLADAALLVPAPASVAGHVRKEEEAAARVPDRSLGEGEAGAQLLYLDIGIDEVVEPVGSHVYGH